MLFSLYLLFENCGENAIAFTIRTSLCEEMVNFRQKRNTVFPWCLKGKFKLGFLFQVVKYFKGTALLRRRHHTETAFQILKVKVAWVSKTHSPLLELILQACKLPKHDIVVKRMV